MKITSSVLASFALLVAAATWAQDRAPVVVVQGPAGRPFRAVTEYGDYLMGLGHAFEGLGNGLRQNAEAQIGLQKARALDLRNDLAEIEGFWAVRDAWIARDRAYHAARRPTKEQLRELAIPKEVAVRIYVDAGEVAWPDLLRAERFAERREKIETILLRRGDSGGIAGIPSTERQQLRELCSDWLTELQREIDQHHPMEYSAGRQFLGAIRVQSMRRQSQ